VTTDAAAAVPSRLTDWKGTERYEVRRFIGAGSMGTVYEAFDRDRGQPVALKRLRHFSPSALYLFKQEFRGLVDVVHPNLVRLHELVATDPRDIFFAMELVRGAEFLRHVRVKDRADPDRLRSALKQLVEGVQALHAAGKLHRDVKPSNALVTSEGRVVLLDFGVATDIGHGRDDDAVVGTAAYMAPEQAAGDPPTPACDWYSVGAILYEALTGQPPLVGSSSEVLRSKSSFDAEPPSRVTPHVPPDLDALCTALLQRTPAARPSGAEILGMLGMTRHEPLAVEGGTEGRRPLFGRDPQLALLRDALSASRKAAMTVLVGGPTGMGKTALVQEFLDELADGGQAVLLRGRAYERESVPYKAVDSWIDALSRHLLGRSNRGATVPVVEEAWALARLFPVLRRVPEIADTREKVVGDPLRLRRLGFGALRQLLGALATERPLVVSIDDVHWGDADSAALLLELVRPPDAPTLLLVMTYRSEERSSPLLQRLRAEWPAGAEVRELEVEPLAAADARAFALSLLGPEGGGAASDVASESGGSPFLIEELARSHRSAVRGSARVTLERAVAARLAELPERARHLFELVAVGGRPLSMAVLESAARSPDADELVEVLRARRFVRVGLRSSVEVVEASHARIGEVVRTALPPERVRALHSDLARVLEAMPGSDPESIALHLVGAGQKDRAGPFAERAAEDAIGKLAFDRAAQLFRLALDARGPGGQRDSALPTRLAHALAWAGRGQLAAQAYLEAAEHAQGVTRLELERASAEQLLASGRIDEGGEALRRVLAVMGMSAPRSTLSALVRLLLYRAWLSLAGLRFVEHEAAEVRHEDRVRIEAMFTVAMGFALVDVLLGACMQARCLSLALRSGDREQVMRATIMEAGQRASAGGEPDRRERDLFAIGDRLAARSGDAASRAFVDRNAGVSCFLRGRWSEARQMLDASTQKLAQSTSHLHANSQIFAANACYFMGELKELAQRTARAKADAEERGDLYTLVNLATTVAITTHLVAGDPEGARRQLRHAMKQWSQSGFLVQQWQAMVSEPDVDIYAGDGAAAYERFARDQAALRRSFMLKVQFVRSITHYANGRCAVASIEARPLLRDRRLAEARRCAVRLRRERMPWVDTLACTLEAAVENAGGERDACIAALHALCRSAERTNMSMYAAAARYRLAELRGGGEVARDLAASTRELEEKGVRSPAAMVAVYLPGRWS
jgi:hypothetical protein